MNSKHQHLILDFDTGEITGLALPKDINFDIAFINFKRRIDLIGPKDGINTSYTTPDKFDRNIFLEVVYRNGIAQQEGISSDYIASESIIGTGYDTINFIIPPLDWEQLTVDYYKKV